MPVELRVTSQAFKYALAPTPSQEQAFRSHAGGARFAYNRAIDWVAEALDARAAEKAEGRQVTTKVPGHFDLCKMWTAFKDDPASEVPWVGENFVGTYQAAMRDAAEAWRRFFGSRSGEVAGRRVGRPRYKSRSRGDSFQVHGATLDVPDYRHVKLPKIGVVRTGEKTRKLMRILTRGPQEVPATATTLAHAATSDTLTLTDPTHYVKGSVVRIGVGYTATDHKVKKVVVVRDPKTRAETSRTYVLDTPLPAPLPAGTPVVVVCIPRLIRATISRQGTRWYVALTIEYARPHRTSPSRRQRDGGTLGIDLGVRDLITSSAGSVYTNPRHLEQDTRRLRAAQQAFSRCPSPPAGERESRRRAKARRRVTNLHARIARKRRRTLDELSTSLIHQHAQIIVEGWNVQRLAQRGSQGLPNRVRRQRNRALADSALGMLRWMLEHKAAWYGCQVLTYSGSEPTNRTCHRCAAVRAKPLPPTQDLFVCATCGWTGDRRLNTALLLASWGRGQGRDLNPGTGPVAPTGGDTLNARGGPVRPVPATAANGHGPVKRVAPTSPHGLGPGAPGG